ncbi:MAG: hypothetical protein ACKOB4_11950 [Acidobacteriota bacterium]
MNPKSDRKKKADSARNRLIKLPDILWQQLDNDAHRCRRSTTKQIEAILISYYELDEVGLETEKVATARKMISSKTK